jgi:hypothetical protein
MFIPDLNFFHPGSRTQGQKDPDLQHRKKITSQIPSTCVDDSGISPFLEESGNKFLNYLQEHFNLGFGTWRAVADSIPNSRSFSQFTSASIRLVDVLDTSRTFYLLDPYFDA